MDKLLTQDGATDASPRELVAERRRGDVIAVAVLLALPMAIFGIPALAGRPVLLGDDLTQNFPLRVLAGQEIRAGLFPLFNPYIWSGAPLLAGWNAGAAYPLTWIFAILPGVAAWTVGLIATWAVAGLGMFGFLRAQGLRSLASFLGALSFAYAGAMPAQVSHFGLVAGMSWVPTGLLAVLRVSQDRSVASRLGWTAVLATITGLVVLAGEPRAVDDACVIIAIYAAWRVARLGRRAGPAVVSVAAGAAAGVCLAAVQWLPGLAAISTSQRATGTMALYGAGSLPDRWLLLMLVPDLLGGSGSLGQPSFFAGYNLTEVTSYLGILPLVAAFALLGRLRLRQRLPEWIVWHVVAVVGIVLALGDFTPLGGLLYHVPLFGDQRLQSRNVLVLDLALAVLLAYWADRPFPARQTSGDRTRLGMTAESVLGMAPALAVLTVALGGLTWGAGLLHWLGIGQARARIVIGQLQPWLVPYVVLGAAAVALVAGGRRLRPKPRARILAGFVVIDLVVFTLLSVVALPYHHPGGSRAAGNAVRPAASVSTAPLRPVAALGYQGRFAIYDPGLIDSGELPTLGAPDLNSIGATATPSIQGYSSLADGRYAAATGTHRVIGGGQDTLSARAIANGTLDQLDTSILLTVPAYLTSGDGGGEVATGPAGAGRRDLAIGQRTAWYLGAVLEVSRVTVPDPDARMDAKAGTQLGLQAANGRIRWFTARAMSGSVLGFDLARPQAAVAVAGRAYRAPSPLGPPSITTQNGGVVVADGHLQDALVPPRWTFAGFDGSFAVFADRLARGPLTIEALPGRSVSGAWIAGVTGAPADPAAATVFSPHGARVVRSVAAIPGWTATWHPGRGRAMPLTIRRDGLIQAVNVPPGRGVLIWSYTTPGFQLGRALSLLAAAALAVLLAIAVYLRASDRVSAPAPASGPS